LLRFEQGGVPAGFCFVREEGMADDIAAPELKGEADLLSSLYPDELLYYVSTPQHLATIVIFDIIVFATTKCKSTT